MKYIKNVIITAFLLLIPFLLFCGCAPNEPAPMPSPKPIGRIITADDIKDFVRGDPIEPILEKLGEPVEQHERDLSGGMERVCVDYLYAFEDGRTLNIGTVNGYLIGLSVHTEDAVGEFLPQDKVTGFNEQDFASTLCLNRQWNFMAMRKSPDTVYLFFNGRQKFNLASSMEDTIKVAVEPEDSEDMEALAFYVRFVNGDTVTTEYRFKYNEKELKLYQTRLMIFPV